MPCGISDTDIFASSTPTASECVARFHIGGGAATLLDAGSAVQDDVAAQQSMEDAAGRTPVRQVFINVPISVPMGLAADACANRLQVSFETLAQSAFNEMGEAVLDVKLRLCGSAVPPAGPVPLLLAQALPTGLAHRESGKPAATAVCCHWKQKGWCAYKDTCKFLHPEHKRGVGAGSRKKDGRKSA